MFCISFGHFAQVLQTVFFFFFLIQAFVSKKYSCHSFIDSDRLDGIDTTTKSKLLPFTKLD